ncbi:MULTISPECIES: hypothetical protein [unclassified Rhizobium]|nr:MULTISPECIES: hypothetical protein [unclassified Rhizobium]MDH7809572.1 hypothetical protein [Rhizobium sp. AN67]MDQ4408808.1 hypothetical protein [Rhizobium sp. AN63]
MSDNSIATTSSVQPELDFLSGSTEEGEVILTWTERGGPVVEPPDDEAT